ncbi:MAG: molybdate ABC transporter substrate-binding protein, partial [Pseudomonadota bacterium]
MLIALRLLACLAVLAAPVPGIAREITVFAAASLRGALDEVAAGFPQPVVLSYAASSALARQIAAGAPADVFVSANPDWMDRVATSLVARRDLLTNRLVIVGTAGADPIEVTDLPGRLGNGRLAMALVDAVPAGIYGRAALASLGVWDAVEDRVAQADSFVHLQDLPETDVLLASDYAAHEAEASSTSVSGRS